MPLADFNIKVDEIEATDLMLYHLRCAAAFFECTHADGGKVALAAANEAFADGIWKRGAQAFIEEMVRAYEDEE